MGFSTTNGRIYIVETSPPFERVEIQFMPEGLTWSRMASIDSISIVGRNNSNFQYTGGDDSLKFTVDFYSDNENRTDVKKKVDFLRSLTMRDGGYGPARTVKVMMGKFFRNETWILRDVETVFSNYDHMNEYLPIRATVKLSFILDTKSNVRIKDVRA